MIWPPLFSKYGTRLASCAVVRSLRPVGPLVISVAWVFAPWQSSHSISMWSQFVE